MRKLMTVIMTILLAAAVAPSAVQAASKAKAPKPAKARHASGTIESYDASAKTLTVKGSKSTWTFAVGDSKVWMGSKSMEVGDLSGHSGSKVTVTYSEKDGQKVASSVRVAAARGKGKTK